MSFLGLGQDIEGTGWKLSQSNGVKKIIIFEKDKTFSYLNVKINQSNEGDLYNDEIDTWKIENGNIIISFVNGFKINSGKINIKGDYMSGDWENKKGNSGTWSAELIKF